jgi:hypothetical protein
MSWETRERALRFWTPMNVAVVMLNDLKAFSIGKLLMNKFVFDLSSC